MSRAVILSGDAHRSYLNFSCFLRVLFSSSHTHHTLVHQRSFPYCRVYITSLARQSRSTLISIINKQKLNMKNLFFLALTAVVGGVAGTALKSELVPIHPEVNGTSLASDGPVAKSALDNVSPSFFSLISPTASARLLHAPSVFELHA